MNMLGKPNGFSLIELLIAMAVFAIISTIAFPAYQEQVRRASRTDAKVALTDTAQRLERCLTQERAYNAAGCVTFPVTSADGQYSITSSNFTATTFTLTATPVSGSAQVGDADCTALVLTHTGSQTATGANTARCW
ncbi:MAG: prepilin-type N-terminal cleavage/methylation domain-containing protein [Gammaproteobacteria bacterium]|nr:prepilin-type N-terminal cleavage/methylation domain-containing protein [Gammaproteobacteria bacterium]